MLRKFIYGKSATLREFVRENNPFERPCNNPILWRQLRALFTTICITYDLEADTYETDTVLREVYGKMQTDVPFEVFENYMLEDIV